MSSLHAHSSIHSSTFAPSEGPVHTGEAWCSAATKDPWDPCILTLDGGGIRGYSSLIVLQGLMHKVAIWERKLADGSAADLPANFNEHEMLPCHYFDYMYGTSTGGLIAVMLGRLRMTVPQCLEVYRDVGNRLFGKRRSKIPLTTKYHHKPLERSVRQIVQAHCKQHTTLENACDGDDWFPWEYAVPNYHEANAKIDYDRHICQSICLTSVHNGRIDEARLLRTYNHEYDQIPNWINPYNEGADKLKIWQVTRATSAAPFYFDWLEAELEGEQWRFKDGGIRENNPSGAAWNEFISIHGESKDPALLLSVGTGRPDETNDGFATDSWPLPFGRSSIVKKFAEKLAVLRNVLIKYTDGEQKHLAMLHTARGEHSWYKRLNVDKGLEGMPLDEWKPGEWTNSYTGVAADIPGGASLTKMETATLAYLDRPFSALLDTYAAPSVMLNQAAEKLVRQRRARYATRALDPVRWDTYMGRYLTGRAAPPSEVPDRPLEREIVDEGRRRGSILSVLS